MKFTCLQKDILNALSTAQKAIGSAGTLPILENILIAAEGNTVEVSATNLEISITTSFEASIQNEGKTTVPAKTILSWISLTENDNIEFSRNEGETIQLKTKNSKTSIKGISADEFPSLPSVVREKTFQISEKDFKKALDQVVFATASTGTRPVLSGVFFKNIGNDLIIAGTDSYRLSERKIPFQTPPKEEIFSIIPAKTLIELERILPSDGKGNIEVIVSKNQIVFLFNKIQLISRLIDGKFPDYTQIIPKEFKNEITIDRKQLIQVIKRVGIFARENNNNVKLFFEKDSVRVTTDATEIGTEEATLPLTNSGEENSVAINGQFLLDILLVLSGEQIIFHIGKKLSPIAIFSSEMKGFVHVIMPLKV